MYSRLEVFKSTLQYFRGDELAANKWIEKYCLKNTQGDLLELNPGFMHRRMAKEFARIEAGYPNALSEEIIFELFKDFRYLAPQGSPMYGIGNNFTITSLSNCFVIGNNNNADSYGSIMRTDEEQVQVMKRRGGAGHDLSHLRPSECVANGAKLGFGAGMPLFMNRYSSSTREVAQDGRRGALMLSVHVKHPDAGKFIDAKLIEGKVTGANISVKVSDEFMLAVEQDKDFIQTFPIDCDWKTHTGFTESLDCGIIEYNKLYPLGETSGWEEFNGQYAKRIKARDLWMKIVQNVWQSAEPGLLFWDTILMESPADVYEKFKTISTNPCGEIPLSQYDSCRLLAINLYSYVMFPFTKRAYFNFDLFKLHVSQAQRIMDDLVDLELEKINQIVEKIENDKEAADIKWVEWNLWEKIKQTAIDGRRTGLGVLAEGDMLAALGFRYGSEEAIEQSVLVHKTMAIESYRTSIQLAKERGSFPIWSMKNDECGGSRFLGRMASTLSHADIMDWIKYGRRNISNLTIAPTGTTSLMTQTTSGIEPMFIHSYKRRTKVDNSDRVVFVDEQGDKWEEYNVVHPKFIEWYRIQLEENFSDFRVWYDGISFDYIHVKEFLEEISENLIRVLFEQSPYYKATANDIDWINSVKMQGAIQQWVDHSISKTVNVPKNTAIETVGEIYLKAWKYGCKGVTLYRDGSRTGVLVSKDDNKTKFAYSKSFKRPVVTQCDIYHKTALKKSWMLIVGKVDDKPYEIFNIQAVNDQNFPAKIKHGTITKVKSKVYRLEGFLDGQRYVIDDLVSLMSAEEGVNTRKYSAMLRHGMAPEFIAKEIEEYATIVSFDKVVQRVLRNYFTIPDYKEKCPECGGENYHSNEGCYTCLDCGFSKCG